MQKVKKKAKVRVEDHVDEGMESDGTAPTVVMDYEAEDVEPVGEMEVGNIKMKWADMEEDDGNDWIEEMWGKEWKENLKKGEAEDECEVKWREMAEEDRGEEDQYAWDDVNNFELPLRRRGRRGRRR